MSRTASKLFQLMMMLQRRGTCSALELAQELGVSRRTVHRYMDQLDEMGLPVCSERDPHGGYSLMRGYRLPPLLFSAEEATVLYLGARLVREVLGETFDDAVVGATTKLDNVLPDDLLQQVARTEQTLVVGGLMARDYRPFDETIHVLRQSIDERRQVRMVYRGAAGDETERRVDPYAMALQWGWWYLVGYCHLRGEMRTFRVDRVEQVTALECGFSAPRAFSVREYLEQSMRHEPRYQVQVRMRGQALARATQGRSAWLKVEPERNGSALVGFGSDDLGWATGWVLSWGPEAQALEPPELVAAVKKAARGISAAYSGLEPSGGCQERSVES